jgi:hypothetical protein
LDFLFRERVVWALSSRKIPFVTGLELRQRQQTRARKPGGIANDEEAGQ